MTVVSDAINGSGCDVGGLLAQFRTLQGIGLCTSRRHMLSAYPKARRYDGGDDFRMKGITFTCPFGGTVDGISAEP